MITTKQQEREALDQIREIIAGLGDDSYVATALEGCLDDAETNINNDWALSMNGRWQDAERKLAEAQTALIEVTDKLVDEGERAELLKAERDGAREQADHWQEQVHEYMQELNDVRIDKAVAESEIDRLNGEIIRLKAKLYDLMTAGA